ncbi:5'-nucleotidase, partial [Candidatus Hakubella thermalkaliphila]
NGNAIGYAVAGTPADCVKLGLTVILKEKPDLVISGINLGSNVGTNIIYSGTVSAATEGTMLGIPSMSVSLDSFTDPDFTFAGRFAARLAEIVVTRGLPKGTLLNVNIPAVKEKEIKGIRITRQGVSKIKEIFHKRTDPRNRTYYWLDGEFVESDFEPDIDIVALKN